MTNEQRLAPYIKKFSNKIDSEDFVIDKSGVKMVELIAPRIELDPTQRILEFGKVRKTPLDYMERELIWYDSQSLSTEYIKDYAQLWVKVASDNGYINSNYGWCIYSKENGHQYKNTLRELRKNPDSRRASMIYTRPTMHTDYNDLGKSDFVCTNAVTFAIRDNRLNCVVQMRSNDLIFGYLNDSYWHKHVQSELLNDLLLDYPELELGDIIWNAASAHIYERHFYYLYHFIKTGDTAILKKDFRNIYSHLLNEEDGVTYFIDGDLKFKF